jgi:hypothetical protein
VLIGVVYSLILTYAVYEALILSVWLLEPSFYSQFYLARDGLPFLAEHVNVGWRALAARRAGAGNGRRSGRRAAARAAAQRRLARSCARRRAW